MTAKYFAILTSQGAAKLANATALGTRLNLTQMAVGDGNGALPTPDPAQTRLVNQKRIASLNMLSVDPQNSSQIIAEQIIPENEGGFWIREIGLYDDTGVLIAVANCPETYKPQLQEGSGRTQTIRMILIVSNADAVTLKIDPAVVLATRKYVDDKVIEVINDMDAFLSNLGFGEGSALPVGVPVPWPLAIPPTGWLKCNGATFAAAEYPRLAQVFPGLVLPDLRGEFIRGWDDGRGIDNARTLLSKQKGTLIPGDDGLSTPNAVGINNLLNNNSLWGMDSAVEGDMAGCFIAASASQNLSNSAQLNIAGVARPRNVAFNYIVRGV